MSAALVTCTFCTGELAIAQLVVSIWGLEDQYQRRAHYWCLVRVALLP